MNMQTSRLLHNLQSVSGSLIAILSFGLYTVGTLSHAYQSPEASSSNML